MMRLGGNANFWSLSTLFSTSSVADRHDVCESATQSTPAAALQVEVRAPLRDMVLVLHHGVRRGAGEQEV
jgi:hypothetical protein